MKKPRINHQNSIASKIISSIVDKDDFVLYKTKIFWETLKGSLFYADESEITEYKNRIIFIKANNSVIKNEILLKKDEIKGLINVYLRDKLNNDKYPISRVIVN